MKQYDIEYCKLDSGAIRLIQDAYGSDSVIDLHPEQLLSISRQAYGMTLETADKVSELERRIAVLTDKLQDFACDESMRREIIERCGYGLQYLAKLDGMLDLALEYDGRLEAQN
mgnify:CR=1 FL=1|jgi:hypothetical protein